MNAAPRMALCALLLAAPFALPAGDGTWCSVAEESELRFSAYYEGEELRGSFGAFAVTLELSADTGEPAALIVEVETASADMNDREINAEIGEPEWFDVGSFPAARFESDDLRATDAGYLARGHLRLKGLEKPLDVPLEWQREGNSAVLSGAIRMSRENWQIGTGEWANDASLSDRVDVNWRVLLVPAD